jgi:hypothetical protein
MLKIKRVRVLRSGLYLLVMLTVACVHEPFTSGGNPIDPLPRVCDPDTVYFVQELLPLFRGQCASSGCHDQATASDGVVLDSYSSIVQTGDVDPFDPQGSKLYKVLLESDPDKRMPRPPASAWSSENIAKVAKWIEQGALETDCAACDSTETTYSAGIEPILSSSCRSCHSGSAPPKGVRIETYTDAAALAADGRLIGVLSGNGYLSMPPGGSLDACNIHKIEQWVLQGYPNN